jgi:hypothetical protein
LLPTDEQFDISWGAEMGVKYCHVDLGELTLSQDPKESWDHICWSEDGILWFYSESFQHLLDEIPLMFVHVTVVFHIFLYIAE